MSSTDLFIQETKAEELPLANRLFPRRLDEFIGQETILGKNKLLRRLIEADRLCSVIFFGPPGTGKTALAKFITTKTKAHFVEATAVTIGVAEIRKIINAAYQRKKIVGQKTLLILDEIHHFNRSQQDALLPHVEKGTITLIGITTENPYFYINSALLSRLQIFEFKPLRNCDLEKIARNALQDSNRGLGKFNIKITQEALKHLIIYSEGDARKLLNALEVGVITTPPNKSGIIIFDLKVAEESIQKRALRYDKGSDEHYDHISAFIKSMRGSDPDAAVYWLTKMLLAGEDARFIARRVVISAAEDVGNADPHALVIATAALNAVEFVGMPEAKIPLTQAVIYVSCAPKSNAVYNAISACEKEVLNGKKRSIPEHLKDSSVNGTKLGHGKGYLYPHNFPDHFVSQEYLPDAKTFYIPTEQGYEKEIKSRLHKWKELGKKKK